MTLKLYNLKSRIFRYFNIKKYAYNRKFSTRNYYNVLFFGSDNIALSSLKKVNDFRKKENVIKKLDLVITNTSKHKTEIENYAFSEGLKTINWPLSNLRTAEYDVGLIVAFGHLIKDDILEKFPLGMINVHPSLLPRWRGAAPIIYTLLYGDKVAGVSLMKIKPNIFDVGEIISQKTVPVSRDIKQPELTAQLSEIGANMLVECLRTLPDSLKNSKPQSSEGVTYAKKINRSISEVRWAEMDAIQVYNLYRAIYGIYTLTTKFKDKQMKLFNAFITNPEEIADSSVPPGTLQYCNKNESVKILCRDRKYVHFKSVRIVGKREISAVDFYNGYIKNLPTEKRKYLCCVTA
ncbi:methionyl-tRNA formyltransferase, mitochondrial [Amyelois transitella]|uniref:methionyl-tRNA formyltransferase, mitochondrial n=1 Tax=Amyelois transitella TaxID=680683 RepID=UPI00067AA19E|nr:methionyl-tRNA formyltransferase, mitochondrial [Amyelois transitella]